MSGKPHSAAVTTVCAMVLAVIACSAQLAVAQNKTPDGRYPEKPLRFIVPYPAGGATDVLSRMVADRLATKLGQPVVADNRPGAAGNIGLDLMVKSPRDGYTISMPSSGAAISVTLYPHLPFNPLRDFAPITLLTVVPNLLITPAVLPATTLKEFIALAKAKPGGFNYGSGGIGATNHIATELFKIVAGVQMTHVPYKSTAQALTDVIAGQIQLVLIGPPAAVPHVQAVRLRALAVASTRRYAGLPDVPTVAEAGVPGGLDAPNWYGIVAGAGTPKPIVQLLNREIVGMLKTPEMGKQLLTIGAEPRPMSPEEFGEFFRKEVEKWAKVIKSAHITAE